MIHEHGRPVAAGRDYDRVEIALDGVVHGLGLVFGIVGVTVLIVFAVRSSGIGDLPVAIVYATGLLAMLGLSAAYNLWPVSRIKWVLRRFDHSAIYLLIAATYTPFIALMKNRPFSSALLVGIWSVAAVGIALKLTLPGRFDRLALVLYLLLGWSGVTMYETIIALPATTLWLLGAGGLLYTLGVIFHLWESLRFQNAIWHCFVVLAAACHYTAVLDYLGIA
jgi:hemolysin III